MNERALIAFDKYLFENLNEVDDSPEKIERVRLGAMKEAIAAMWVPFDPEDKTTWPEKGKHYLVRLTNGTWEKSLKLEEGWTYPTVAHYQQIIEP